MIDLHCHILPGLDDGAPDVATAVEMARAFVADGVTTVACTPHILPGLYHNTGPQIRRSADELQRILDAESVPLRLVPGADVHIVPGMSEGVRSGRLLSLADSRYVLVEPPHHTVPVRLEDPFFDLLTSGYVPILTHPERLRWIRTHYHLIRKLAHGGVWMQITGGSLTGAFGKDARYWAERMLEEGLVHILATDAHDVRRRPPELSKARDAAAKLVGDAEAEHLVVTRPRGIVADAEPGHLPAPTAVRAGEFYEQASSVPNASPSRDSADHDGLRGIAGRLRRLLG